MGDKPMSLVQALSILVECHTRDDELTGYVVHGGPYQRYVTQSDYLKAWASVRQAIGRETEPNPLSKEKRG